RILVGGVSWFGGNLVGPGWGLGLKLGWDWWLVVEVEAWFLGFGWVLTWGVGSLGSGYEDEGCCS
ncbi:MAG TPA: hypothetical protein PLX70_12065, partial [Solirubrobacterales bacterium]|nr:hypothetical protein [Solirubrobacterales bacterium]